MKTNFVAAILAASLAASFAAPPAAAQGDPRPIAVSHADLDLTTARGRAALDLRLLHAARAACGTPSPADPRGPAKADECVARTLASAAVQRDAAVALAERQSRSALASR